MNSTRTPAELRKAATDAGWESDPLASEILVSMDRLASEAVSARKGPPTWAWLAVGVAIVSATIAVFQSVRLTEARAQHEGYVQAKEAEIASLKAANVTQIEATTAKLNALVTAAEAVTKASATAADSNQAAVGLVMGKFQELLDDYKKAQDAAKKPKPEGP